MKYKILKIVFVIWIILWIAFTVRELFRKGYFWDYKILVSRSLDGKRSYVTGDKLYGFLTFSNNVLPGGASYGWIGVEDGSIDKRRATYYLYPHLEKDNPDFILVYAEAHLSREGYGLFAKLDETRYILKRKATR